MQSIRWMSIALVFSMGCAGTEDEILSWDEFHDQAYQEEDTGVYVINGDEAYETVHDLASAYERYVETMERELHGIGRLEEPLAVYRSGGRDIKWSASQARNLTYCITRSSFTTSQYNAVVSAMNSAAGAWEGTANVNFIHSSSRDSSCSRSTTAVVFNVRRVTTSQYLARAFWPNTSRSGREVLIATSAFGNISPWTLAGILRHELGHTLGFRHEHTRPEAGVCFEDNAWRALTTYDSSSVMHYPQCNGTQGGDLVLTSRDRSGARALYP